MKTRSSNKRDKGESGKAKLPIKKNLKSNIIHYRTSGAKVNKAGEEIKHSFFASSHLLSMKGNASPGEKKEREKKFCNKMLKVMSDDKAYRPAKITKLKDGIPTEAVTLTPSKTKLKMCAQYRGSHIEFSNEENDSIDIPKKSKKRKIKKNKKRKLKVTPPNTIEKTQTIFIDAKMLEEVRAQIRKNNGRRKKSQNSVMGGSANDYAENLGKFLKSARWEWLHLIAHRFLADKAQNANNMVGGPSHVNTRNMFAEDEIVFLLKHYPGGIEFTVKSILEKDTHIAIKIEYTIKTKDFSHPIVFDAQDDVKPHINEKNSFHAIFEGMVSAHSSDDIVKQPSPQKKKAKKMIDQQEVKKCWMPITPKQTQQKNSSDPKNKGLLSGDVQWHLTSSQSPSAKLTPSKLQSFFYHSPSPLKASQKKFIMPLPRAK